MSANTRVRQATTALCAALFCLIALCGRAEAAPVKLRYV